MPLRPFNNPSAFRALFALAILIPAAGQELQKPPDFSQNKLAGAAEDVRNAWVAWQASDKGLEQQIYAVPMTEARERIQTAFSDCLAFLEKRRTYTDSVLRYIEAYRPETASVQPGASNDAVNSDQIELLGVNLSTLQNKLDALRAAPDWARIRRNIQAGRAEILELQNSRRQDFQTDRPRIRAAAPPPISSILYADSERQTREALQKLWTRYYQVLVDSIEQKPGGSALLVASPDARPGQPGSPPAPAASRGTDHPLVGTWTYNEGSQQFNGVAEPRQVILELWMDKGVLAGRYRAQLPDFEGTKRVDINLRGKPVPGRTQTLEFDSGKLVLQGPGASGIDLMVVRSAEPGGPIPRGRELLTRH